MIEPTTTAIDARTKRAVVERMTVEPLANGMYTVTNIKDDDENSEYVVDVLHADDPACQCKSFEYHDGECKHIRRAKMIAGKTPIPQANTMIGDYNPHTATVEEQHTTNADTQEAI